MTTPVPSSDPPAFVPDAFQVTAIAALERGDSVLVSAPTGTGKTFVADAIVARALATNRSVIYTAPIKALSNQKYRDYCRIHGSENVGLVTGDLVIRRDAPCLVMTTEILRNMLLQDDVPTGLLAVVLDEIHFLDDRERGTTWEEVLMYLPPTIQILGLSATLSNLKDFAAWLTEVRGRKVQVVEETRRAVPLRLRYGSRETGLREPVDFARQMRRIGKGNSRGRRRNTTAMDVVADLVAEDNLPILYFVFSRRDTEAIAGRMEDAADELGLPIPDRARVDAILAEADGTDAITPPLARLLRRGVGFHHAGAHVLLKAVVERLYEAKLLSVLCTTSTFALGVNMPARTVVFDGVFKFDGRSMAPLTYRQFMQKAGRAGRRGLDEHGEVVIRVDPEDWPRLEPVLDRLRNGTPEPVRSTFNLSFHSVINLVVRHGPRARDVVERSFLAWHLRRVITPAPTGSTGRQTRSAARADRARNAVWDAFQEKVQFLTDIGYLAESGELQAGGRVVAQIQIAEVFTSELILAGVFEDLEPDLLFGLLCAVVGHLPRGAQRTTRASPAERQIARIVQGIADSDVVVEAARLTEQAVDFDADWIGLGRLWASGRPLSDLSDALESNTDVAGDLVNGLRRAKDLLGQLADVYREDAERRTALRGLLRRIDRDEVIVVA